MLTFHYECVSHLETKIVQSFIHVDVLFSHLISALNASNPLNLGLNFNINVKIRMPQTSKWNAIIKQWLHGSY